MLGGLLAVAGSAVRGALAVSAAVAALIFAHRVHLLFGLSVVGQFKNFEHFVDGFAVLFGVIRSHHVTDVRAQVVFNDELAERAE